MTRAWSVSVTQSSSKSSKSRRINGMGNRTSYLTCSYTHLTTSLLLAHSILSFALRDLAFKTTSWSYFFIFFAGPRVSRPCIISKPYLTQVSPGAANDTYPNTDTRPLKARSTAIRRLRSITRSIRYQYDQYGPRPHRDVNDMRRE